MRSGTYIDRSASCSPHSLRYVNLSPHQTSKENVLQLALNTHNSENIVWIWKGGGSTDVVSLNRKTSLVHHIRKIAPLTLVLLSLVGLPRLRRHREKSGIGPGKVPCPVGEKSFAHLQYSGEMAGVGVCREKGTLFQHHFISFIFYIHFSFFSPIKDWVWPKPLYIEEQVPATSHSKDIAYLNELTFRVS